MAKKLGKSWAIKRKSDREVVLSLPEGMKFTSENISIQDVIDAIEKHKVITNGDGENAGEESDLVTLRCCSGNTAIAAL